MKINISNMSDKRKRHAWTDENGFFEIKSLSTGTYSVAVDSEWLKKKNLACKAVEGIGVEAGLSGSKVKLELRAGLPVTILVYDEKTDEVVGEQNIYVALKSDKKQTVAQNKTNSQGKCVINLMPGEYVLKTYGWGERETKEFLKDFTVDATSGDGIVEMPIIPRPTIYGYLIGKNGKSITGSVFAGLSYDKTREKQTNEYGEFAVLAPWGGKRNNIGVAFDSERNSGKAFLLAEDKDANDLVVILEPLASIEGKVVDENGKAVANVEIRINISMKEGTFGLGLHRKSWWCDIKDQADGSFIVDSIPVGLSMKIEWKKAGYNKAEIDISKLRANEHIDFGDIVLESIEGIDAGQEWNGIVTGKVLDENGKPLVDVLVHAELGDIDLYDDTDIKGRYELKGLPEGELIPLRVFFKGYSTRFKIVCDGNDFDIQLFPVGYKYEDKDPAIGLHVDDWLKDAPRFIKIVEGKVALFIINRPPHDDKQRSSNDAIRNRNKDYVKSKELMIMGLFGAFKAEHRGGMYLIDREGIVRATPTPENVDEWIEKLLAE